MDAGLIQRKAARAGAPKVAWAPPEEAGLDPLRRKAMKT